MKNIFGTIWTKKPEKASGKKEFSVDRNYQTKEDKEKEIVEILSYKLGLSKDELFTYIDTL